MRVFASNNSQDDVGCLREVLMREKLEIRAGDVRNSHMVEQTAEEMQVMFHLRALISIPNSYLYRRKCWRRTSTGR
jgi:hypothetical protein